MLGFFLQLSEASSGLAARFSTRRWGLGRVLDLGEWHVDPCGVVGRLRHQTRRDQTREAVPCFFVAKVQPCHVFAQLGTEQMGGLLRALKP